MKEALLYGAERAGAKAQKIMVDMRKAVKLSSCIRTL
jgi:hypothetical protein